MQPVQDCLGRAVLFQGFVVTSILDAYHISLLLKCIIVKTQGRFLLEIIPWMWSLLAVLVMFRFMFVHYTFSSVLVAEWPPFGK